MTCICDVPGAPNKTLNYESIECPREHNPIDVHNNHNQTDDLLIEKLSSIIQMNPFKDHKPGDPENQVTKLYLHSFPN